MAHHEPRCVAVFQAAPLNELEVSFGGNAPFVLLQGKQTALRWSVR